VAASSSGAGTTMRSAPAARSLRTARACTAASDVSAALDGREACSRPF
jgi:hypothetical protein